LLEALGRLTIDDAKLDCDVRLALATVFSQVFLRDVQVAPAQHGVSLRLREIDLRRGKPVGFEDEGN